MAANPPESRQIVLYPPRASGAARLHLWPYLFVVCAAGPIGAVQPPTPSLEADARSPLRAEAIYAAACQTCHGADGRGSPGSVVGFDVALPDSPTARSPPPSPTPTGTPSSTRAGRCGGSIATCPQIELLWARPSGSDAEWDIVPQMQVTLSKLQHIAVAGGVRIPLTGRDERSTQALVYVLWDWFDGGPFEFWK